MSAIPGVPRVKIKSDEPIGERAGSRRVDRLLLLAPGMIWLFLLGILPLGLILVYSFAQRGTYGGVVLNWNVDNYIRIADPLYLGIFVRSLILALETTIICLVAGYPLAYAIATAPPRHKNLLLLLVVIPFWTNFLIRTYAWIIILRTEGLLNALLLATGLFREPLSMLYTPGAVLLGFVYNWLPFMVLPIYASIEKINRSLIEAAMDLGARGWQILVRVIIPLSLPGIAAGSILIFIPSLAMFAIPDLMGGARAVYIGNLIKNQFLAARNWPFGSALSICLVLVMLVSLFLYARVMRREGTWS
ncbi:MAG TPA: ABC transporter permease [Firmicutes bacterium]|nr:ABC transporter permease [Bacillota bacterium]